MTSRADRGMKCERFNRLGQAGSAGPHNEVQLVQFTFAAIQASCYTHPCTGKRQVKVQSSSILPSHRLAHPIPTHRQFVFSLARVSD